MNEFHDKQPLIVFLGLIVACVVTVGLLSYCTRKSEERRLYDLENGCHPTSEVRKRTIHTTNCVMIGKVMSCTPQQIPVRETLWVCDKNGEKSWR